MQSLPQTWIHSAPYLASWVAPFLWWSPLASLVPRYLEMGVSQKGTGKNNINTGAPPSVHSVTHTGDVTALVQPVGISARKVQGQHWNI